MTSRRGRRRTLARFRSSSGESDGKGRCGTKAFSTLQGAELNKGELQTLQFWRGRELPPCRCSRGMQYSVTHGESWLRVAR